MQRRYIHFLDPYQSNSAGQRVSHYLAYLMHLNGYPSYVYFDPKTIKLLRVNPNLQSLNPAWQIPILIQEFTPTENDVVIYWDGKGDINPLNASNIVRFFGYYPSASQIGGGFWSNNQINQNELPFCYDKWLKTEIEKYWQHKLHPDQILTIPSIEPNLFFPQEKTIDACHYFGKGKRVYNNVENIHVPCDSIEIEATRPKTREGVANILNHCKTFYSFDPDTLINQEAQLAGCEVYYCYNHSKLKKRKDKNLSRWVMNLECDKMLSHQFVRMCDRFFGSS